MSHCQPLVRRSSDHQISLPLESRLPANNLAGAPRGLGPFFQPNSSLLPSWSSCPSPLPLHSRSFFPSSCSGYHTTPRQTLRPRGSFLQATPPSISFNLLSFQPQDRQPPYIISAILLREQLFPFEHSIPLSPANPVEKQHTTPTSEGLPRRPHGVASEETSVETPGNRCRCA